MVRPDGAAQLWAFFLGLFFVALTPMMHLDYIMKIEMYNKGIENFGHLFAHKAILECTSLSSIFNI